jgi:hypothetical protein
MRKPSQDSSKSLANSFAGIWRGVEGRFAGEAVRLPDGANGGQPPNPRDICGQMKGQSHVPA